MKKISAMLAAALIALTLSVPALAEPSEEASQESSVSQSEEKTSEEGSKESSKTSEEKTSKEESKASSAESSVQSSAPSPDKLKYEKYRVEEAKMDISFPDNMYVITRDTDANDPAFEAYRLTKNEIMKKFEESSTYIRASAKDFSYDITVTVMKNSDTQAVKDLSSLSDKEIESVINNLLKQDVYKGCTRSEINNTLFLTLNMEEEAGDTKISGIQEYTIVGGVRVIITFQTYDGEIDEYEKQVFDAVMKSTAFDGVDPAPKPSQQNDEISSASVSDLDIRYIYIIIASTIGLIALVVMITAGMRYKKTKKRAQMIQEAEENDHSGRRRNTTALVDNDEDTTGEPEDIYSDTRIEKYGTQEFSLSEINTVNNTPMTYESLTAGSPVQEKLAEDTVNITELPEDDGLYYNNGEYGYPSTQPEGFTEIEALPADEEAHPADLSTADERSETTEGTVSSKSSDAAFAEQPEPETEEQSADDEVVFAESTEKRHTDIEQIGVSEKTEDESTETAEQAEQEQPEISAFEKRFGKFRTTPPVTASAAASPDIMLVNTDEKRASKFEKHFGKLTPAAQEETKTQEETKPTEAAVQPAEEAVKNTASPAEPVKAPEQPAEEPAVVEQPTEQAFSKLIDRLRSSSEEAAKPEENTTGTGEDYKPENNIYRGRHEPEKPEETKPAKKDTGGIALEISKGPDGGLIIGALNEGSGKPLDIEIKDSSDLKAERRRRLESMGFESADSNEIYNRSDDMSKDSFTVKAKEQDDEETGSRFDKLFGADREKKPEREKPVVKQDNKDDEFNFEESAFEKRFGKNKATAAGTTAAAGTAASSAAAGTAASSAAGTAAAAGTAVTAGAISAVSAGTAAVAAVFGKAEKSKGKKQREAEPGKPETVEEFFEGVKAEKPIETPAVKSEAAEKKEEPAKTEQAAKEEKPAEERRSRRDEFMFERDSGIIFEHARESKQPIEPIYSKFTNIPRLESVNAEEYNRQYDEMRKSMPKNQTYAQRFTSASSEPAKEPAVQQNAEAPANEAPKAQKPQKDDSTIEFYTGYEENDPFAGNGDPNQEVIIKDHKKKSGSVGSRFRKSFSKFFSSDVPEDEDP